MTIKGTLSPVKDHAAGLLSGSYDSSETSITLATGHGARLPDTMVTGEFQLWFYRTDYSVPYLAFYDTPRQAEKVLVTARAGDVLTVTRDPLNPINMNVSGKTYGFAMMPDEYFWTPLIDYMPYSVKRFGAKGDGATDDTTAIQNAINAAVLAGGGRIFFPPGTYKTTSTLSISSAQKLTLFAFGDATVQQATASTDGLQMTNNCSDIRLLRLRFLGPDTTPALNSTDGVLIGGDGGSTTRERIWVEECVFEGWSRCGVGTTGTNPSGTPVNRNITIRDNYCKNCNIGVFCYKATDNSVIRGNLIESCWQDGIALDTLSSGDTDPVLACENIVITNNVIRKIGDVAVAGVAVGIGIVVKGLCKNIAISGNTIDDVGSAGGVGDNQYGIEVVADAGSNRPTGIVINGNAVSNIQRDGGGQADGIFVANCDRFTVIGNTVRSCERISITIYDSQYGTVNGNITEDQAIYAIYLSGMDASNRTRQVIVVDNTLVKGAGAATIGVFVNWTDTLFIANNLIDSAFNTEIQTSGNDLLTRAIRVAGTNISLLEDALAITFSYDTNIYRGGANILKTDDQLQVAKAGGNKNELKISSTVLNTGLEIGGDCNLYRAAANKLKTDDSLEVAGQVKDARCAFLAHRNGSNQTLSAPPEKVQFGTEEYDLQGNYDAASTYRFTAPRAMLVRATVHLTFDSIADGKYVIAYIYKNGASHAYAWSHTGFAQDISVLVTRPILLAQNDYLEAYANCNDATPVIIGGANASFFSVEEILPQ